MNRPAHRLVLDLSFSAGELRATLANAARSSTPIQTVQTWASRPLSLAHVRALYAEVTAVLNRANRWGDLDRGSQDLLRQRGRLLFDEVLPSSIKRRLRELGGGELTLVLDEELVFIPFELMHSGADFVGLAWAVGRIVRTRHAVVGRARPEPDDVWRMLVLCDPRGDLMGSYDEGITIRDELDGAGGGRLEVDLRTSEVGVGDIKQVIREYDIIHYAGHAEIHPERPADSGWLLSDGVLSPNDLLDLAGGPSFPRVVFSNACRSGRVDGPMVAQDHGEAMFSVANAFLLSGVNHYVGALWDIPDEPACQFSLAFYDALTEGASLGEAIRRARRALGERYGRDTVLWASYVLYGDPSVPSIGALTLPDRPLEAARVAPPTPTPTPTAPRPVRPPIARVRGRARALIPTDFSALPDLCWRERARRLWPQLALAVAALAALLLVALNGSADAPAVFNGPFVADRGVEAFPAPRDSGDHRSAATSSALAAAPAAVPIETAPRGPELAVVAQRADAAGDFHEELLGSDATLHSWDNFQLRLRLGEPGHVAIWHIESQGAIAQVHPTSGPSARVDNVGWVELPGRDTWFYLDERRGIERFVLGVSHDALTADEAFAETVAALSKDLQEARAAAAARAADSDPLTLRGLGGVRPTPTTAPSARNEARIIEEIDALFAERFDEVRSAEFHHR